MVKSVKKREKKVAIQLWLCFDGGGVGMGGGQQWYIGSTLDCRLTGQEIDLAHGA